MRCYPSKAFPLPCEKHPPKNYNGYRKWDDWYCWRYLMELKEDPEDIYQIGMLEYYRKTIDYE